MNPDVCTGVRLEKGTMKEYFKVVRNAFARHARTGWTLSTNVQNLSVTRVKTVLSSSRDIRYDSSAQVSESIYRARALHANGLVPRWIRRDGFFQRFSYEAIFQNYRSQLARSLAREERPNASSPLHPAGIRLTITLPRRISISAFERNGGIQVPRVLSSFSRPTPIRAIFKCISGWDTYFRKLLAVLRVRPIIGERLNVRHRQITESIRRRTRK